MTGKYGKTHYTAPDKVNRVDVRHDQGYTNINVYYNLALVGTFKSAGEIVETKELLTTDKHRIEVMFLTDSPDFEVHFDGVQIDDSHTSPKSVVRSLHLPIYISLSWYAIIIAVSFIWIKIGDIIGNNPLEIFTNIGVIYFFTSSVLVSIILVLALLGLRHGNLLLYMIAFISISADMAFGTVFQVWTFIASGAGIGIMTLIMLTVPIAFKVVTVSIFYKKMNRYKQIVHQQAGRIQKDNSELVDA